jgi:hypothetical protein
MPETNTEFYGAINYCKKLVNNYLKGRKITGEDLKVVSVKFSTLSLAVFVIRSISWHIHECPCLET